MFNTINPYIAGNPVTGAEMFFGREDVFRFVSQTLVGQHRDNVIVLYGQRRTGKTSVLYQMRSHLSSRYFCIFVDLHGFALEGLNGFLWELANHMTRVLRRDYQIDLPPLSHSECMADPRNYFESEFLGYVWSAIGDQHILLMMDEAVRLQEQVQLGKLEPEIFTYMRHLMQHHDHLNFLFSLGSGLEEMEKEYSFLFSVGLYKKISFLERNAAVALITQPAKDCYEVEPTAVERILHITSGHPYYTQLLCHSLFNRCQQQYISLVEVREVDEVLDEVVERGLAVLKHVWEESTMSEKAVLAGMAAAMGEQNRPIDISAINRAWTHYNVTIPKGEMAKAIKNLLARDVIAGRDTYTFAVDLQRLWVQKYRRLEWVKEEIVDTIQMWSPKTLVGRSLQLSRRNLVMSVVVLVVVVSLLAGLVFSQVLTHLLPTMPTLTASLTSFNANADCAFTGSSWVCATNLSSDQNTDVNWSASSREIDNITFKASSHKLLSGKPMQVLITIPIPKAGCPAKANFTFTISGSTLRIPWTCAAPILKVSMSNFSSSNCQRDSKKQRWNCTAKLSEASESQGDLHWLASSSDLPGLITFQPQNGVLSLGKTASVTIFIPDSVCNYSSISPIFFEGPGNTVKVQWNCTTTTPTPCISLSPTSLSFVVDLASFAVNGGPNPLMQQQQVTLLNCGGIANWSVSNADGIPWLSITPSSGTLGAGTSQSISVVVDSANLVAGTYTGTIKFTINNNVGTENTSVNVVLIVVSPQPTDTPTPIP